MSEVKTKGQETWLMQKVKTVNKQSAISRPSLDGESYIWTTKNEHIAMRLPVLSMTCRVR